MSLPRYPEYKNSGVEWLGDVPAHWHVDRIKASIESSRNGIWGDEPQGDESDIACVRVADFDRTKLLVKEQIPTLRSVTEKEREGRTLRQGNLLLEKSGGGELQPVGQVVMYQLDTPAVCSNFVAKVVLKPGMWSGFWKYVHSAAYAVGVNIGSINQTSGIQNLDQDRYFDERAPYPPEPEQAAIATFLDRETGKIDALIAEQEKLLTLLAEKRQATISHAVTKGLNPDAPMKDSGVTWLGEVPEHWKTCPLKLLGRIGNGSTPNRDNPDYWGEEGFPWLNSSVVNQDEVTEAQQFVTPLALKECHLPIVAPPAILIGITGQGKTRGMATRLAFTATVNQHLAYVKPDESALALLFLLRVLESAYEHLRTESEGAGSTKGAITCEQLGRLRIPLPPIAEQHAIAAFLDCETAKLDSLKIESEHAIALLKERRSALIAAAVTGQIDVRQT